MRNIDERDVQLAEALDQAVRGFDPSPEERLQGIRRKGSLRRALRWTAVCTALFLFLGATGWAALRLAGNQTETASPTPAPWRLFEQSDLGWSLEYPESWRTQEYDDLCGHGEDERTTGVLVTNVRHVFRHPEIPNGCTGAWDMRGLPSDLVLIAFGKAPIRFDPDPLGRDSSSLPLSLESAEPMDNAGLARYGTPETGFFLPVTVEGVRHTLHIWIGAGASAAQREIAERIVASIQFEDSWLSYVEDRPEEPFTFEYPADWFVRSFECSLHQRANLLGVRISNVAIPLSAETEPCQGQSPGQWAGAAVAVQILWRVGGPSYLGGRDSQLPIELSLESRPLDEDGLRSSEQMIVLGNEYTLSAWAGADAREVDLDTVADIVASISLAEGPGVPPIDPLGDEPPSLPKGWSWTAGEGEHFGQLTISTNPGALEGLIEGCLPTSERCGIRSLEVSDLGASDAYISIWASYPPPCLGCSLPPPLPSVIEPDDFSTRSEHLGVPVMILEGEGRDEGYYLISYWIGPDASAETRVEATAILTAISLP